MGFNSGFKGLNNWRFRRRTIQPELQNGNGLCESYIKSSWLEKNAIIFCNCTQNDVL